MSKKTASMHQGLLASLGAVIEKHRAMRDMTVPQLCAESGISQATYWRIAGAQIEAKVPQLSAIAYALGSTPSELLAEAEANTPAATELNEITRQMRELEKRRQQITQGTGAIMRQLTGEE